MHFEQISDPWPDQTIAGETPKEQFLECNAPECRETLVTILTFHNGAYELLLCKDHLDMQTTLLEQQINEACRDIDEAMLANAY